MRSEPSADALLATQESQASHLGTYWARRKRMLRIEAWVVVVAMYAILAFGFVFPADFRNESTTYVAVAWVASLVRTFVFHLGLVMTVVALIAALLRRWRLCAASVPLLCFAVGPALYSYLPENSALSGDRGLTVMSVNLLKSNTSTGPILEEIKEAAPDILLLQEYTPHWHEAIRAGIGPDYPHVCSITRDDSFGMAIYSRVPFEGEAEYYLPIGQASVPGMRVVIEWGGEKTAVYNIHLLPPSGMIYIKEHRAQFADLLEVLDADPLPVIMGGDFNFTETSANASELSTHGFMDAFTEGGWGRGATWPVHAIYRYVPGIRLDHIYLRGMVILGCRTGTGVGSDHRPVIARLSAGR